MENEFINGFNAISSEVHNNAISKGWWNEERNDGEIIALIHSELSEALEAMREGDKMDDKVPEFTGVEVELADAIIRIMDYAGSKYLRVAEALIAKMRYNETRSYKHGGKSF